MTTLANQLAELGLRETAAGLDDLIALATKKRFSHTQLLEHIADRELKDRARRSVCRRLCCSKIGRFKPVADFDWSWPDRIDRDAVEAALRLEFLEPAGNIVLVAPQGLGKTTVAKNIAHNAVLAGHSVLFVTAAQMLLDLSSQESARALDRRLRHYQRFALLVVDEIGYLSLGRVGAHENETSQRKVTHRRRHWHSEKQKIWIQSTRRAFRDNDDDRRTAVDIGVQPQQNDQKTRRAR